MDKVYHLEANPKALDRCMIKGEYYRISVLTERLIRMEYSKHGVFEDRMTQTVINKDFLLPQFSVIDKENQVDITTKYLQISYDKREFSSNGLSIRLCRQTFSNKSIWRYRDSSDNLMCTARTLDEVDGAIELQEGILSRKGFALIDDSQSMTIGDDGWVQTPLKEHHDIYFWGYGHDYMDCIKDFFHLCGKTPLLPRYALGNWWSRFHAYTQKEYMELMDRFKEEGLPFSVAVIDMDWHHVKLEDKYGSGWTGYSWNKELFPDHREMLNELHERGFHISLNVHPADGVRAHEDAYEDMAKELGTDYENEIPIAFDIADPEFLHAYFSHLHHPLEEEGVDFWWIDWQQGSKSKIPGLDPLWACNHYHTLDNAWDGRRPVVLSRYGGLGSHRYPVGFSGDTFVTWRSLKLQPYFTATAANCGYTTWSHDIGGHQFGRQKDGELYLRWIQFGVFSPILRLHSTRIALSKEPWNHPEVEDLAKEALRFRHKLIPYIYSEYYRNYLEGRPIIEPMYYGHPTKEMAYKVGGQYFFGSKLIVAPITSPANKKTGKAKVKVWLPRGEYTDIFTGEVLQSGTYTLERDLTSIPVFARSGSVIPLGTNGGNSVDNPRELELLVYRGKGRYRLYEDKGDGQEYQDGAYAVTQFRTELTEDEQKLIIFPAEGDTTYVPESRDYKINFANITRYAGAEILKNGEHCEVETDKGILLLKDIKPTDKIEITLVGIK